MGDRRRPRRAAFLPALVLAVALAVTACTSAAGSSGGPASGSSSAAPSPNGIDALTAAEALERSRTAMKAARWVHVKGTQGGTTLDLHVGPEQATGTVSEDGLTAQLLATGGHTYLKADRAFWNGALGTDQGDKLAGRWVLADDAGEALAGFTDIGRLADLVLTPEGTVTKGAVSTVDGQQVLGLVDSSDGSTLFLATLGPPYPVTVRDKGATADPPVFDGWGVAVTVTAPPASEVVDPGAGDG